MRASCSFICVWDTHSSLELVTGTYTVWSLSRLTPTNLDITFLQETRRWVITFYITALVTNLITTSYDHSSYCHLSSTLTLCYLGILALKLWLVHRRSLKTRVTRSQVYPIMRIIMESGALYSMSLVAILAAYPSETNVAYILTDMVHPLNIEKQLLSCWRRFRSPKSFLSPSSWSSFARRCCGSMIERPKGYLCAQGPPTGFL